MYYAYVDPATGSDTPTTVRRNTNAATAEASPWATLAAAEQYERTNLTTLGDSLTIRCKSGVESSAGGLNITSTNWPGMTTSYYLQIEAASGHYIDGKEGTTVGYTFKRTGSGNAIATDAVVLKLVGIRIIGEQGRAVEKTSSYERLEINRCVLIGSDGFPAMRAYGNTGADRLGIFKNTVFIAAMTGASAVSLPANNTGSFTFEHCAFIGYSNTAGAVDALNVDTYKWCYATNRGSGGAYAGAGWATSTRTKNASSDTTGDATYQSIAFATGSGGYFTNVTAGSADLSIGASSALKEAATDSSETVDIIGTSRPQGTYRDIGAFELAGGGSSVAPLAAYHLMQQ
jgi:hypothetical protein